MPTFGHEFAVGIAFVLYTCLNLYAQSSRQGLRHIISKICSTVHQVTKYSPEQSLPTYGSEGKTLYCYKFVIGVTYL